MVARVAAVRADQDDGWKTRLHDVAARSRFFLCGRDDEVRFAIAPSFGDFIAFVARLFASGRVLVRPEDPTWLCASPEARDLLTGLDELLALDRGA